MITREGKLMADMERLLARLGDITYSLESLTNQKRIVMDSISRLKERIDDLRHGSSVGSPRLAGGSVQRAPQKDPREVTNRAHLDSLKRKQPAQPPKPVPTQHSAGVKEHGQEGMGCDAVGDAEEAPIALSPFAFVAQEARKDMQDEDPFLVEQISQEDKRHMSRNALLALHRDADKALSPDGGWWPVESSVDDKLLDAMAQNEDLLGFEVDEDEDEE